MTDMLVRPLADNRMLRAAGGANLTTTLGQTLGAVFETPMMTGLVGQSWAEAGAGLEAFTEEQRLSMRQSEFDRQQEVSNLEAELQWTPEGERRDEIGLRLDNLSREPEVNLQAATQQSLEEGRLQEPESLTEKYGELGLQFDRPMTESEAQLLADNKRAEMIRQSIISKGPTGLLPGVAKFGAGLAAMAVDPLEVASMFIPVVGVGGRAAAVGRFGKVGGRVLVGATEGFVGSALTEPIYYGLSRQQQLDYTMSDALLNVGLGTIFGGGIGAIGGVLARADVPTRVDGEPVRVDIPEAARVDIDPITARIEREKADVALRQFANNQDVDVTPISPPPPPPQIKGVEVSFSEWVADSKVVDSAGEPLTVFHGTSKSFDRFDPEMRGEILGDASGYFFTNERSLAKSYSQLAGGDRVVLEAQLSIKDPLEINVGKDDPAIKWLEDKDEYMRQAEAGKHDGVIVRNDEGNMVPIAFDPDQVRILNHGVKSAEMKRVEAVRLAENAQAKPQDAFQSEAASKAYDDYVSDDFASEAFVKEDIQILEDMVEQISDANLPEVDIVPQRVPVEEQRIKTSAQIEDAIAAKYPDIKLSITGNIERGFTLNRIEVPADARETGIGTRAMEDIVQMADEVGAQVNLTPDTAFGGTKGRLVKFYKRFGFVENKGKNKDFTTMEAMYRDPDPAKIVKDLDVTPEQPKADKYAGLTPEHRVMMDEVTEMETRAKAYADISRVASTCMART